MSFLVVSTCFAQGEHESTSHPYYGGFVSENLNIHSADFRTLPGVPSCCPRFERGNGFGFDVGALYGFNISSSFHGEFRLGYSAFDALLSTRESTTVNVNDQEAIGVFEHTVDAAIKGVVLNPLFRYTVSDRFNIGLGGSVGLLTQGNYAQKEAIVDPVGIGTFENKKRTRNEFAGAIPQLSSFYAGLNAGVQYLLPLNHDTTLTIRPELTFSYGLTPFVGGMTWYGNRVGLGIAVVLSPKEELPPILVVKDSTKDTIRVAVTDVPKDTVKHPVLRISLGAFQVDSLDRELPLSTITIEEYIRTQYRPLLNYIFFDENSDRISDRYRELRQAEALHFSLKALDTLETLPLYYEVLNIVGKRLELHPQATLKIVGCNADIGSERNNKRLSRSRAEKVKNYLERVWNISPQRLSVEARNLPEKPSNPTDIDGAMENRRVELYSNDWHILEPVFSIDTARVPKPGNVKFGPQVEAEAGIDRWELTTSYTERKLKDFFGRDTIPQRLDWELEKERENLLGRLDTVSATLTVTDRAHQISPPLELRLPVRQYTLAQKKLEGSVDTIISRYSLILFDFDRSELSPANQRIVDFVKLRISEQSRVNIFGYTDRIGNDTYNRTLSEARAKATQKAVGIPNAFVKGYGRSVLLYDNSLPEGRFYSRTVTVVVTTPTKY